MGSASSGSPYFFNRSGIDETILVLANCGMFSHSSVKVPLSSLSVDIACASPTYLKNVLWDLNIVFFHSYCQKEEVSHVFYVQVVKLEQRRYGFFQCLKKLRSFIYLFWIIYTTAISSETQTYLKRSSVLDIYGVSF